MGRVPPGSAESALEIVPLFLNGGAPGTPPSASLAGPRRPAPFRARRSVARRSGGFDTPDSPAAARAPGRAACGGRSPNCAASRADANHPRELPLRGQETRADELDIDGGELHDRVARSGKARQQRLQDSVLAAVRPERADRILNGGERIDQRIRRRQCPCALAIRAQVHLRVDGSVAAPLLAAHAGAGLQAPCPPADLNSRMCEPAAAAMPASVPGSEQRLDRRMRSQAPGRLSQYLRSFRTSRGCWFPVPDRRRSSALGGLTSRISRTLERMWTARAGGGHPVAMSISGALAPWLRSSWVIDPAVPKRDRPSLSPGIQRSALTTQTSPQRHENLRTGRRASPALSGQSCRQSRRPTAAHRLPSRAEVPLGLIGVVGPTAPSRRVRQ